MQKIKVKKQIDWRVTMLGMEVGETIETKKSNYHFVCRFANRLKTEGKGVYTVRSSRYNDIMSITRKS